MSSWILWEKGYFLFVLIVGSLLHFVFHASKENRVVGALCPVNESTWEHLKMLFFPSLIATIAQYILVGHLFSCFILSRALGVLVGMMVIISVFYTYVGIVGRNFLVMDIFVFVIGVAASCSFSRQFLLIHYQGCSAFLQIIGILIFALLFSAFCLFTFFTPRIALFLDPVHNQYGIIKQH